ncbi:hypothetical protein RB614_19225 [Phytohabitans sp. ZYX-F-186]|uniref:Lipoprotein n=1 Tax=Phytohabitans maris TaxID=3071409 RepID=A0ABU0ZJH6_9ACTN|nr:hypothetical protein [Phytohabitans sp. ZYX-F-186]MDQ7906651.1 hypothetical protein [Phytohabitans sp. ZYX-F-186]
MKMAYARLCVVVAGLLAFAACDSPSPSTALPPPTAVPSTGVPAPSTAVPLPATAAAPTTVAAAGVTVERTGGFVGIDQNITVEPDGRWTYYRSRVGQGGGTPVRGRLNDAQLADLRALLADPQLGREVGESSDCADGFVYTLVTGPTKVEWADCGTGSPPTAMRVVDLLSTSTPF